MYPVLDWILTRAATQTCVCICVFAKQQGQWRASWVATLLPLPLPPLPFSFQLLRFTGATDLFIIGSLHNSPGLPLPALIHLLIAPPPSSPCLKHPTQPPSYSQKLHLCWEARNCFHLLYLAGLEVERRVVLASVITSLHLSCISTHCVCTGSRGYREVAVESFREGNACCLGDIFPQVAHIDLCIHLTNVCAHTLALSVPTNRGMCNEHLNTFFCNQCIVYALINSSYYAHLRAWKSFSFCFLTLSVVICCGFFLGTNVLIVSRFGQERLLNALSVNINVTDNYFHMLYCVAVNLSGQRWMFPMFFSLVLQHL